MAAPDLYLFASFDVDPLSTAIASGADCTFEPNDGTPTGWTAGTSTTGAVNSSSEAICHAGTVAYKVTRTGSTGSAAVSWQGNAVAGTAAGGWYGTLIYVLPGTTARSVSMRHDWTTAGGSAVGSASTVTITETVGFWQPLLLLSQQPATAAKLKVTITWLNCAASEVHYQDTFSADYLGTQIAGPGLKRLRSFSGGRGADNEFTQAAAGTATFVLRDTTGNLSPDSTTAPAPYLGNVDSGRQIAFAALLPSGRWLPWFWGEADSWAENVMSPTTSEVTLKVVDTYRWGTAKEVLPPYLAEVMMDGPVTYLPLGDKAGTTSDGYTSPDGTTTAVGSVVGDSTYAPVISSRIGPGGTKFGDDPILPKLATGRTSDDDQPAVTWNPVDADGHGDVIVLTGLPGALLGQGSSFTVEMWVNFALTTPLSNQVLWRQALGDAANGLALVWQTDGLLYLYAGSSPLITGPDLRDNLPHYIAVTWNSTFATARLWWDSGSSSSSFAAPYTLAPDNATLGGVAQLAIYNIGFDYRGRMGHFAIYNKVLTDARLAAHWIVGAQGGSAGETEGNRFGGVLNLASWPPGRTRVDVGQSLLLGRSWSKSAVLTLLQSVAGQGSARPWADAWGKFVMRNRHYKVNQAVQAVLSPLARRGWAPEKNDDNVVNKQRVTRTGGPITLAQDAASILRHGEHAGQDVELAIQSDPEAAGFGKWVVQTRKDNTPKYPTVTFQPGARPALWEPLLLREPGHRVQVPGPKGTIDGFIEKIEWKSGATPRDVEFTLTLSQWRQTMHQMAQVGTGTGLSQIGNSLCQLGWY